MTSSAVQMGAACDKMQQAPNMQPMEAVYYSEAAAASAPMRAQQVSEVAHQISDMTMTLANASNAVENAAPMLASKQPDMHMQPNSAAPALLMTGNGSKVVQPAAELRMSSEVPPLEPDNDSMHLDSMIASLGAPSNGTADSSAMQQSEARDSMTAPEQPRLSAEQVLLLSKASVYMHGLSCVQSVQQWDHVCMSAWLTCHLICDSRLHRLFRAMQHRT